jgi:hypothetical protein
MFGDSAFPAVTYVQTGKVKEQQGSPRAQPEIRPTSFPAN